MITMVNFMKRKKLRRSHTHTHTHTHILDDSSVSLENSDVHPNLRVITLTITVLNISGKRNDCQPRLNKQSQLYVS